MKTAQPHIVVLDDNPDHLNRISGIISNHYATMLFDSTETLFEYLDSHNVNLLFLSTGLTERYFLSIIAEINERWHGLPLILTDEKDSQRCGLRDHYHRLARGVIQKTISRNELITLIERTLKENPYSTLTVEKQPKPGEDSNCRTCKQLVITRQKEEQ